MDAATHNQHKNIKQKKAHLGPKKINEKEVVTNAPRKVLHLDVHGALALRPSTHAAPQRWGGTAEEPKGTQKRWEARQLHSKDVPTRMRQWPNKA